MLNPHISVVIPVYGCKEALYELYLRLTDVLNQINKNFEIIFVDDRGPDKSWQLINEMAQKDQRVIGLRLSRNFGQHKAITAGLEYSKGEWVVVMDCDLQDKPEEITKMYHKALEGYDIVLGRRSERKDSFFKRSFSKLFYMVLGYLTETKQDSAIANFGIYSRSAIDAVCSMKDSIRYFPAMIRWVGFDQTQVDIDHGSRELGKTSYSFKKLLHLGIEVILAFSDKPLRLTVKAGIFISILSLMYSAYILVRYLLGYVTVLGYTSIVVSIWLMSGIIIFLLGMVGLYIGKTFDNVKGRPIYIVKDTLNVH